MSIVLVYWFLLFVYASLTGIAIQNIVGLSKTNKAFTLLFGIIFQTLFLSICAFFYRIHVEVFVLNCLLQVFLYVKFKSEFISFLKIFFKSFSNKELYLFVGITILIASKSAQLPTIFDNESYYLQTIKWLNEYGFVKGVANVHPFLGQFSFWHVLQSGFSFPFLTFQFNDINGFIVLIGVYYFIEKHNKIGFNWTFFGILFLVFYYQFIDAPSPDLPILVFSAIVFSECIDNSNNIKSILLFIIFMLFIKVTIAPILLIGAVYLFKNRKVIPFFGIISCLFGCIWIVKNIIITGYPLFPLQLFPTNFDWKMNSKVITKLAQVTIDAGYTENKVNTINLSLFKKINYWFQLNGINAIFNRGILFLFLIIPFTKSFKVNNNFKILYFVLLMQFLLLLIISPQYRFFLPTFILFSTILLFELSNYFKFSIKNSAIVFSLVFVMISLIIDIKNAFIMKEQ